MKNSIAVAVLFAGLVLLIPCRGNAADAIAPTVKITSSTVETTADKQKITFNWDAQAPAGVTITGFNIKMTVTFDDNTTDQDEKSTGGSARSAVLKVSNKTIKTSTVSFNASFAATLNSTNTFTGPPKFPLLGVIPPPIIKK